MVFKSTTQEHWVDQRNAHKIKPMHITSEESVEDMVFLLLYICLCLTVANILIDQIG